MPTEITAPRINSNMAPSQSVAGVEIEAADGKEAEANRDENQVQHVCSPKESSHSWPGSVQQYGAAPLRSICAGETDLDQPLINSA
ncbi:MAG TPA: hypothetical protein VN808_08760 [Stellaceae bacterium]|nr:hypothetical protein [Stellaceae bacterium]